MIWSLKMRGGLILKIFLLFHLIHQFPANLFALISRIIQSSSRLRCWSWSWCRRRSRSWRRRRSRSWRRCLSWGWYIFRINHSFITIFIFRRLWCLIWFQIFFISFGIILWRNNYRFRCFLISSFLLIGGIRLIIFSVIPIWLISIISRIFMSLLLTWWKIKRK